MNDTGNPPAAEEIIAALYARITALRDEGRDATAIVLPPAYYRSIQAYRSRLGDVREGLPDYLGKYELFGLPLYTDNGSEIVIKTGS